MFRIFAFAAAIGMAASAGTASAHPPDLYDYSYNSGRSVSYGTTYSQPSYGTTYGTSSYVSPSYSGVSYGSTYSSPSYATSSYTAPSYRPTYTNRSYSNSGYSAPSYGYRHRKTGYRNQLNRYVRNPYANYPVTPYGHRSFGPYEDIPTTEGFNVGYAGGPTYGTDQNPVINGVRLNGAPN